MLHCHILPIKEYESLFKKPFDSKILDICKASRTSPFKRKIIDKDSVLKQGKCTTGPTATTPLLGLGKSFPEGNIYIV